MERSRLSKDEYFLAMASLVASRGTCRRRQVGCVLVDHRKHVLATGYNGVAAGVIHCLDVPCKGADLPSGTGLDQCEAIHAEQNAILQCRDVSCIETAYITTSPCPTCTKLLMNTGCSRIIFIDAYTDQSPRSLWKGEWREYGPIEYVFALLVLDATKDAAGSERQQGDLPRRGNLRSKLNDFWARWSPA